MRLDDVLKKNQERAISAKKICRKPLLIAEKDRPYDIKQTDNKPSTKHQQTGNKLATNNKQNRQQTGNKLATNNQQNHQQTDNKIYDKEVQIKNTRVSLDNFKSLSGLQKNITLFLHKECIRSRSEKTNPISIEYIHNSLGYNSRTIKESIRRLEKKKIIIRSEHKSGRGGWTIYKIPSKIFNEIIDYENHQQTTNKPPTELATEIHSSSRNKNTTTITHDWEKIELSSIQSTFASLGGKGQTFGRKQLSLIFEKAGHLLTSDDVQKTLNHFAYGLKHFSDEERYASIKSPGGFLFNQLSAGDTWDEPRYLTAEEQSVHSIYLNIKSNIDKDIDLHFERWINQDRDTKYEFYSKKVGSTGYYDDRVFIEMATEGFEKDIWPEKRRELILQMIGNDKADLIERFEVISKMSPEDG